MYTLPSYQIFGSKNSVDMDVVFFVDELPNSIIESANICKQFNDLFDSIAVNHQKINSNIAVVKDGVLVDVFKGTSDELNNALFHTYSLHQQKYECQIKRLLVRDVNLKYLRCARMLLSFLTKTSYRNTIKQSLNNGIKNKLVVLKSIDLNKISDFGIKTDVIEMKKTMAFQLGQTLFLHNNLEVYTKDEVAINFPTLKPYIYREEKTDFIELQLALNIFITKLENRIHSMKSTVEYKYNIIE